MKKLSCLFIMLFAFMPAAGEMVAKLPQVVRPLQIALTSERVYIVEDSSRVHIYGRGPEGVIFKKTFGKQGDGPGEFNEIFHLLPLADHLEITTLRRLSRFSPDGRFLDEVKLPIRVFKDGIFRIGENYLARDLCFDDSDLSITICLHDKDFRKLQELIRHRMPLGSRINLVPDYYSVRVAGGQAYVVESGMETKVTAYDQAGARQMEVNLPLRPVKVNLALREALLLPLRNEADWRDGDEVLYGFPEWTPGLDYFAVVDGKFVARTYEHRENAVEFVLFDQQGNEMKRMLLPDVGCLSRNILFCFFQGDFFYLKKNNEEKVWELHSEKSW